MSMLAAAAAVGKFLSSSIIVVGAVVGYWPQYVAIKRTGNPDGFSTLVSLVLLVSNVMRCFFWWLKDFEMVLLYQSLAVILCQLSMISLCVRVRNQKMADVYGIGFRRRRLSDCDPMFWWSWHDMWSYVQVLLYLAATLTATNYLFGHVPLYIEALGAVALGVESMLGVPQVLRNYRNQSTKGLSVWTPVGWLVGDAYKSAYFTLTNAPLQFKACGYFQLVTDMVILYQMFVLYADEKGGGLVDGCRSLLRWLLLKCCMRSSSNPPARSPTSAHPSSVTPAPVVAHSPASSAFHQP